jgi:hypothetical protein
MARRLSPQKHGKRQIDTLVGLREVAGELKSGEERSLGNDPLRRILNLLVRLFGQACCSARCPAL